MHVGWICPPKRYEGGVTDSITVRPAAGSGRGASGLHSHAERRNEN